MTKKVISIRLIADDGETILDTADIESPHFKYDYRSGASHYSAQRKLSLDRVLIG